MRQADIFNEILINAFSQFIPCKVVTIKPNDQPWSNTYTRLLLRRKNRNYMIYKKINKEYNHILDKPNISPQLLSRYKAKQDKAHEKARNSANASNLANRRTKMNFYNTVNATMNNNSVSAKKKFSILLRLMKNDKFSGISPLNENNRIIHDPQMKSEIFNDFFASKSRVNGSDDEPPVLEKK